MKVLNIGSKSIHISSFLERMDEIDQFLFVEESCGYLENNKEYVFPLRGFNVIRFVFNIFNLRMTIKSIKPDIIHIHQLNRFAFVICLLSNKKTPIISTAWGSDVLIMPWKNKLFYTIIKYLLKRSTIITADSLDMIDTMKQIHNSNTKYTLLQYGIEYVKMENKQNVIYSNRLHTSLYRISQIIDYFFEFVQDNDSWKLVIAGIGEDTHYLQDKVNRLKINSNVEFVGWLNKSQNQSYYSKSKVYISIPESDGTSVSLLEAMSAGCIPIVSDLEVSKEWVQHMKNGIIENEKENPFFQIDKLDTFDVYQKNRMKLDEKSVSFEKSKQMFLKLYNSLL